MLGFLGLFFAFLASGVSIALALGTAGATYLYFSGHAALILAFPQRMIAGVDNFVLLTIPLFLLAGDLMNTGGLTGRIIRFANAMVGHFKGGLSMVTVLASMLFAGISGSAVAQSSAIGSLMIPGMSKQGIPPAYGGALVAASSVIDPLIPPSITMIIFGVLSGASIGQMFIAGVVPGIILGVALLVYTSWKAHRMGFPRLPKAEPSERRAASLAAIPALILPLIIVVGIKGGIFTTTEAAAIAALYALGVGYAFRELTLRQVWKVLQQTVSSTAGLLFIIAMANIVAFVLTLEQVPANFAASMLSVSENPIIVLLLLNLMLLILGMFLEPITIMILTMPILLEIQQVVGMNLIQFGVMVTINVVIGMVTPPVGVCLFVTSAIAKRPLLEVSREILPMVGICLLLLALVAAVPAITLALPQAFVN